MKYFYLTGVAVLLLAAVTSVAIAKNDEVTPGHFIVQNKTVYRVEFSGLVGGYASKNPLANHASMAMIMLDPGSTEVKGHIMVYSNQPGHYIDNIIFDYQRVHQHSLLTVYDLYHPLHMIKEKNKLILT